MRIQLAITLACVAGCVAEEPDPIEDLGALGGKADKITTRNVTLHRSRTFTVTTAEAFRASVGYDAETQTRLIVSDASGVIAETTTWQPTLAIPAASSPRALKIKIENAGSTDVPLRFHVATPDQRQLRVATFNIRWYGLGGDADMPKPEGRNATLRAFIDKHLAGADIVMFEEITDVAMLRTELMPDYTCSTYESGAPQHQFVVACLAPGLTLTHEADDTDVAYQPLALGSLRPAVTGIVRDEATRAPLARLVGVHLKALPNSTDRRLEQAKILADRLAALRATNDQLPAIVLGDFNSHRAVDTGRADDDWNLIDAVFAAQLDLQLVEHSFANTFRDKEAKAYKLDHIWLSRARPSNLEVAGPCNLAWETHRADIERHFDEISDHCPVIVTATLP